MRLHAYFIYFLCVYITIKKAKFQVLNNHGFIICCYMGMRLMNEIILSTILDHQKTLTFTQLKSCNDITVKYGLLLSDQQIYELIEGKHNALIDSDRIEFGEGILKNLITAFCDSVYINQQNYFDTIFLLQELFYYFKNESMESVSDDELIELLKFNFDCVCQGSTEYLSSLSFDDMYNNFKSLRKHYER